MAKKYERHSIDKMPLSLFYTEGICLNLSHKELRELIEPFEVEEACKKANVTIEKGDTVLFYTNHYRKHFNGIDWGNGPGISAETAQWLGDKGISAFGVETMSPGVPKISNKKVHHIIKKPNW